MFSRCRLSLAVSLLVSAALAARAEDWTEFRGPTGQGQSAATALATSWDASKNVTWKVDLPGLGWSSPIILGDRIYLTTAVAKDAEGPKASVPQTLEVLCLDKKNGATIWRKPVFEQDGAKIHGKNSHASATPIIDGRHLFVHFGTHGTACLTLAGEIVWKNQDLVYKPVHGNGGSPVLVDDLLVINCDGGDVQFVTALDKATGKPRWKTGRGEVSGKGFCFSTPLVIEVAGQRQIVSAGPGVVCAYAPADGREIWRVAYPGGYSVVPRPVFGNGLLFVCTGYDKPTMLAIRPDGKGDVTETHVEWKMTRGAPLNPSPLVVGENVYTVSDDGIATCLEAKTGKELWKQRIGGGFSSSPVFAAGNIYIQDESGTTTVFKTGATFEKVSRNELGDRTLASFAISENVLFIRSEKGLSRIEEKSVAVVNP